MKSANAETATKEEVTATLATLRVDDATSAIFAAAEKEKIFFLFVFELKLFLSAGSTQHRRLTKEVKKKAFFKIESKRRRRKRSTIV